MPAKKKLTKKKPAAKAAQPSSKKRPMSTKAKPAAKKAAPKAKAKPMAKKKKPAAKKPARRPFHEGGMIDAELEMLERMAMDAVQSARDSATIDDPEKMDRIFASLAMGIDQVREANRSGMPPDPKTAQQTAQAMNQAQFMRPQPPRRGSPGERVAQPTRIAPTAFDPATGRPFPSRPVPTPTPMGPRAGGAINPNPTRVPFNQPPMDRRPQPARVSPQQNPNYKPSNDLRTRPPMDRRPQPTRPTVSPPQQQAMRAMNQARFTRPQITPEMQAAARQRQQGTTPRPMNRGGMVTRPRKPIHPDMPASFGQVQPNKPTGRR